MHHPDARGGRPSAEMAAINGAWHVLSDPRRRAEYDRGGSGNAAGVRPSDPTAGWSTAGAATTDPVRPAPLEPPRFPWRGVVIAGIVGSIGVVVLSVMQQPAGPQPVDNILSAGSCVVFEPNGDVREVRCDDPHDAVVDRLVPFDTRCPAGTEARRDRQGMGLACLRP